MVKITVSKNELQNKLKAVSKVIKPSNLIPQHNSFLFEISEVLKVTGADEMGSITSKVDCVISESTNLSFLIEAKLFLDGLKELPEQPIEIQVLEKNGYFLITVTHSSGTYEMHGSDSSGFSKVEVYNLDMTTIEMEDSNLLVSGIKKVYHFAGNDEIRPILSSVYIESRDGRLIFVSTNTSTMAVYECTPDLPFSDFDFILPVKIAKIISDLLSGDESVELNITCKNVAFITDNFSINYRLLEGKYPNYRSIIPTGNDKILNCGTSGMVPALRRTSIFANRNSQLIILKANNSLLEISGKDTDLQNSAVEKIPVHYSANEPIEIGFKSDFLIKCLETVETEDVSLSFSDPTRACLISPVDEIGGRLTVLIMPMLVNI